MKKFFEKLTLGFILVISVIEILDKTRIINITEVETIIVVVLTALLLISFILSVCLKNKEKGNENRDDHAKPMENKSEP